jgi:hypothetical protein
MDPIIDAVATYRLTRLAQTDTFPPVAFVRSKVVNSRSPEWVQELAECPWCLSMWVGLGVYTMRRRYPKLWRPLAFALAASAVTGLISEKE